MKVDVLRLTNERLLNRILTETRAGRYSYDVVRASGFTEYSLIERGLVKPYHSPERKAYAPGWKDEKGFWTSTDENYFVLGYNTHFVSEAEAPKKWEDLLNPKWKGKIGIDPGDFELYAGLERKWGAEKARTFFERLANQDIQFRKGHTLLAQLVVAGEMPIALVYAHRVEAMKSKGAPIEWVPSIDPLISSLGVISLGVKPQHPNAAKLLIDYVLSKEGEQFIQKFYRIPSRSDVTPITPKLDKRRLHLLPLQPELEKNLKVHLDRFRSFFGFQG